MNTIILNADDAANIYLTGMMDLINGDLKFNTFLDTAESLTELGKDIKELVSESPSVAFNAFRNQFRNGSTMSFLSVEDARKLEVWNDRNEDFQIAIFRNDGQPVGLYGKDVLSW
jgi:hypothetical protein